MSDWWSRRSRATEHIVFSNVQITGGDGGAPSVIPAAPAMLLASPGDGAVPLRWQASFGATSYTFTAPRSAGGPILETIASGITGSSYTDKSVINGMTYYYTVTATNSAGTSGSSPADTATPSHPMMNVATGGIASDSGNTSGAARAFDQNTGTGWFYKGTTGWLRYDLGHTERVQRYTIRSATGLVARDPKELAIPGLQRRLHLDHARHAKQSGLCQTPTAERPTRSRIPARIVTTGSTSPPTMATSSSRILANSGYSFPNRR